MAMKAEKKNMIKESPISSEDFIFLTGDLKTLKAQEKGTECGGGVTGQRVTNRANSKEIWRGRHGKELLIS